MKTVILRSPRYPSDPFLKRAEDSAANAAASEQTSAELAKAAQQSAADSEQSHQLADGARVKAEAAQGKAETAQEGAVTAQGKAETAQGAAEFAQGKAEGAQQAAELAQSKAETAQGGAETAQGKAKASEQTAAGSAALATKEANRSTEQADRAASEATRAAGYSSVVAAEGDAQVERLQAEGDQQATRATVEANRAMNEANRSGGYSAEASGHANRAEAAADRADLISGIENVHEALRLAVVPIPDFHLPLVNDLTVAQGKGTPYQIDVSPAQDGSVMVDLPMYRADFTRASAATYIDKNGVLRSANPNEPRFEKEGILIEGSSTNLFPKSEEFSHALDPENIDSNYQKYGMTWVIRTGGNPGSGIILTKSSFNYADHIGKTLTVSFFIIRGEDTARDYIEIYIPKTAANGYARVYFDNKKNITVDNYTPWCNHLHSNVYRMSITLTVPALAKAVPQYIHISPGWAVARAYQLEELSVASSYIPTNGAPATRSAEALYIKMPQYWTNLRDSISCHMVVKIPSGPNSAWKQVLGIGGGSAGVIAADKYDAYGYSCTSALRVNSLETKVGLTYDGSSAKLYINGVKDGESTRLADDKPTYGDLFIGCYEKNGFRGLYGHIKDIRIWSYALSPEQIANL